MQNNQLLSKARAVLEGQQGNQKPGTVNLNGPLLYVDPSYLHNFM